MSINIFIEINPVNMNRIEFLNEYGWGIPFKCSISIGNSVFRSMFVRNIALLLGAKKKHLINSMGNICIFRSQS